MYPSNTRPNGAALPGTWVRDDGTTYQDMRDAWTWMQGESTATTQVYFWSNHSHGSRTYDVVGAVWDDWNDLIQPGQEYEFDLASDFVDQVGELWEFFDDSPGTIVAKPYWQVISPLVVADLVVILNGQALTLLEMSDLMGDGNQFVYKFGLDATDIANLQVTGNTFEFTWTGGPVDWVMAGMTTGDMSNEIPEPATLSLLVVGGLALVRRRRRT
jgi:hypothetical protein